MGSLWKVLMEYGLRGALLGPGLGLGNSKSECCVQVPSSLLELFPVGIGLPQGSGSRFMEGGAVSDPIVAF